MFPPTGMEAPGGGPPGPPTPPPGLEPGEEEPGGGATVGACAARNCGNNEDGKCGLDEIRVGAKNECANFEGERAAEERPEAEAEATPPGGGIGPRGPAGPAGPMRRRVPPPPAPGRV